MYTVISLAGMEVIMFYLLDGQITQEQAGSMYVSEKLTAYPSPNLTLTLTFSLWAKCWSRGGVGGQFPWNIH